MALMSKGIRTLKNELNTNKQKNKIKKRQKRERWTKVILWGNERDPLPDKILNKFSVIDVKLL